MCFTCLLGIYLFFILYIVSSSLSVFQLMWGILNNATKDVHNLISETCEYVTLHGKGVLHIHLS